MLTTSNLINLRRDVCTSCPLYKKGICNHKLYLNPLTGDVSTKNKEGYINGCGCEIEYKITELHEKCPVSKW